MLEAEVTDFDDLFHCLYDDDDKLDINELVVDDMDWTQTAKLYAVTTFMTEWMRIFIVR